MKGPKVAILLAVAAAAVGMQNYVFFSKLADRPTAIADDDEEESLDWDEEELEPLEVQDESVVASWMAERSGRFRNPFLTVAEDRLLAGPYDAVGTGMPLVTGTLWSRDRRVAWIDGRPRTEGDWVGEHQILRIEPTRVALSRAEGEEPMVVKVARPPIVIEEEVDE